MFNRMPFKADFLLVALEWLLEFSELLEEASMFRNRAEVAAQGAIWVAAMYSGLQNDVARFRHVYQTPS